MDSNFPIATYRLQLNSQFTFKQAIEIVEYLSDLGVSHCYASPLLCAKPQSRHGYDIIDHSKLNPEIGSPEEFEQLVNALRKYNMGIICDIIPNHMYIFHPANLWWNDVLENGPSSLYSDYFDIDWHPPRAELANKVLLPMLEEQYGDALENQSLKVNFHDGSFVVDIPHAILPTDPRSWNLILEPLEKELQKTTEDNPHLLELQSIITALSHLPRTTEKNKEKIAERHREKEIIKKRLATLFNESKEFERDLFGFLEHLNGIKGNPESFDSLELFLNVQPYRPSFWRVANDEINYRRFFDILDLAGIRNEKPEVFEATHSLICQYIQKRFIDGLRIDHIDGLWDPEQYLLDLRSHTNREKEDFFYVVVEKILTGNEKLHPSWPVQGTVGYDFLNQVNGLFVSHNNKKAIQEIYGNFTGSILNIFELLYTCKELILMVSMSSELHVIARLLDRISQQHRSSRDFTAGSLRSILRDVIACFPVYRSYIRQVQEKIHEEDEQYILTAITRARHLNPAINVSLFDFLQNVLLLKYPPGLNDIQKAERQEFVMRFQQFTGPIMAKGLEDTAYYRYFPLASLNDVGGDPSSFGTHIEAFHKKNSERLESWPYSMLTTSTHDTKRSEDVRARINVLSEIPEEWAQALARWSQLNQQHKVQEGDIVHPSTNDEYLMYQSLVGTWPLYPMDPAGHLQYINRIQAYMEKATKEAKINTSWINPNKYYDQAIRKFVEKTLSLDLNSTSFLTDFKAFIPKIAAAGMLNSLSQVLLKTTSPGVPDIYQGNELWDFSLVDPDNRRPVDFSHRKYLLQTIFDKTDRSLKELIQHLLQNAEDGRIKLYVTVQALRTRNRLKDVFSKGSYVPLAVQSAMKNHIVAFARILEKKAVVVIAGRFFASFIKDGKPIIPSTTWKGTLITLPEELRGIQFRSVFTGENVDTINKDLTIDLESVLSFLPLALLESNL